MEAFFLGELPSTGEDQRFVPARRIVTSDTLPTRLEASMIIARTPPHKLPLHHQNSTEVLVGNIGHPSYSAIKTWPQIQARFPYAQSKSQPLRLLEACNRRHQGATR